MRQIVITINMEHAAINENPEWEISGLLKQLGNQVKLKGVDSIDEIILVDSNGNVVGKSVIKTRRKNCLTD